MEQHFPRLESDVQRIESDVQEMKRQLLQVETKIDAAVSQLTSAFMKSVHDSTMAQLENRTWWMEHVFWALLWVFIFTIILCALRHS